MGVLTNNSKSSQSTHQSGWARASPITTDSFNAEVVLVQMREQEANVLQSVDEVRLQNQSHPLAEPQQLSLQAAYWPDRKVCVNSVDSD